MARRKRSIENKVKMNLGSDAKYLYKGVKVLDIDPIGVDVELEKTLDAESQKGMVIREKSIKDEMVRTGLSRGEAFESIREKNFGNILNDMLSEQLDMEYCLEHDIDYVKGLSGKELMMLKLAEKALQGDLNSTKFIVERMEGKAKTVSENKSLSLKGSLEDFMKRIDKNG